MAGEGFVAHMIASLKANKRSRKSTYEKIKHLKKGKYTELYFENKATPEELKILKEKLQREDKIQSLKKIAILIILIAILIYAIGFVEI